MEKVVNITRELTLKFYSGEVSASIDFVACHAARQFGQSPSMANINDDLLYHAGSDMPCYVYFYNDDADGIITVGQMAVVDVIALDYDDEEFTDADDVPFSILVEDEIIDVTILSVNSIGDKNVVTGTDVSLLGLPNSVIVDLSSDIQKNLSIIWNTVPYNKDVAGTYQLEGELQLIDDIKNPLNLKANVNIIVANPITIYAALSGGTTQIAKSTDLGDTWQSVNATFDGNPTCFAKDGVGNFFIGTDTGYIYKLDNGTNTTIIGTFPDNHIKITCLALRKINNINYLTFSFTDTINPVNSMICIFDLNNYNYVQILSGYDSLSIINNGNSQLILTTSSLISITDISTWQVVSSINNFTTACDAGYGIIYAGTSNGHIWRNTTANDYSAWNDLGRFLGYDEINTNGVSIISLLNNGRIYAADFDGNFVYSDDNFATNHKSIASYDLTNAICYVNNDLSLIGCGYPSSGNARIFKSINNGLNYNEISGTPLFGGTSINALIKI